MIATHAAYMEINPRMRTRNILMAGLLAQRTIEKSLIPCFAAQGNRH
jgi:hypothetical protein